MTDEQVYPPKQPLGSIEKAAEPELRLRFEHSPSIGKLVGALAKARKAFNPVIKSSSNPFFKSKYADLAEVLDATKDGLCDNGLAIVQPPAFRRSDNTVEIVTMLAHESGEWIKSILDMPTVKVDPQGVGSAITYGRRYACSGMLSVASEQDDDGNAATGNKVSRTPEEEANFEKDFDQRTQEQTCIAPFQQKAIQEAMQATGKTEDDLKTYLDLAGYKRLEHVLKTDFEKMRQWAVAKTTSKFGGEKKAASVRREGYNWPALFAKAREKGYTEQEVKDFYCKTYNVTSGTELTPKQFAETVEKVTLWIDLSS
jgi:hypothetical protein